MPGRGTGRKAAVRQVTRNSHSFTFGVPRAFRHALRVVVKDFLVLELAEDERSLIVYPLSAWTAKCSAEQTERRRPHTVRKLVKYGNSQTLALPPAFLSTLRLVERDELLLTMNDERTAFDVRPLKPRAVGPSAPAVVQGIAEVRS